MLYSSEKNSHFAKHILLPNILLRIPTVHYGCYLQDSLRCELYTVSTKWLFFAISHLAIIMKSDHHQEQPSSTTTSHISLHTMGCKRMLGSKPCYAKCEFFSELYNIYLNGKVFYYWPYQSAKLVIKVYLKFS